MGGGGRLTALPPGRDALSPAVLGGALPLYHRGGISYLPLGRGWTPYRFTTGEGCPISRCFRWRLTSLPPGRDFLSPAWEGVDALPLYHRGGMPYLPLLRVAPYRFTTGEGCPISRCFRWRLTSLPPGRDFLSPAWEGVDALPLYHRGGMPYLPLLRVAPYRFTTGEGCPISRCFRWRLTSLPPGRDALSPAVLGGALPLYHRGGISYLPLWGVRFTTGEGCPISRF